MIHSTHCSVKRDLLQCQKRPTAVSKETYCNTIHMIHSTHATPHVSCVLLFFFTILYNTHATPHVSCVLLFFFLQYYTILTLRHMYHVYYYYFFLQYYTIHMIHSTHATPCAYTHISSFTLSCPGALLVWCKCSSSLSLIKKRTATLPIQFVQVLTNFWYSHT